MAKYFTDIDLMMRETHLGPPNEFRFRAKKIALGVAISNSIRRSICRNISNYSVAPETIRYESNTSCWDPEMITHQIIFMDFRSEFLDESDLNMMELVLEVKNNSGETDYRWVFANEFELRNKETNERVPIEKVLVYPQQPLLTLAPGENLSLKCSVEKMSKNEAERVESDAARHQSAMAAIEYKVDEKEPDNDPTDILFSVNIQTGLNAKDLVQTGLENLIQIFQNLQESIKNRKADKFYIQINRYFRYDFVFLDEDHTAGNLIEKWINRYDPRSAAGYRQTRDRKSIIIDYGLFKFVPAILQDKISSNDLEEVVERSITSLDKKKEENQRLETIRTFLEHLSRIEQYLKELHTDWKKVSVRSLSVSDYNEETDRLRRLRSE